MVLDLAPVDGDPSIGGRFSREIDSPWRSFAANPRVQVKMYSVIRVSSWGVHEAELLITVLYHKTPKTGNVEAVPCWNTGQLADSLLQLSFWTRGWMLGLYQSTTEMKVVMFWRASLMELLQGKVRQVEENTKVRRLKLAVGCKGRQDARI
jgi:hypothetical protein